MLGVRSWSKLKIEVMCNTGARCWEQGVGANENWRCHAEQVLDTVRKELEQTKI